MIHVTLAKVALKVATVAMGYEEFLHGVIGFLPDCTPKMESRGL